MTLCEVNITHFSEKGKNTYFLLLIFILYYLYLSTLIRSYDFAVARVIDEANQPIDLESRRIKRSKRIKDPRIGARMPGFLIEIEQAKAGGQLSSTSQGRASIFRSFSDSFQDSVVGVTNHAKDWSLHSINSYDYKDVVLNSELYGMSFWAHRP